MKAGSSSKRGKDAHARDPAQGPPKERIITALLDWYRTQKRDLPWRRTRDPYAIWLSEIMLQQTRVETVIPYYERFLSRFPDVVTLADAPLDDVLSLWSGLGYYRRARMLHSAARAVVDDHDGHFPDSAAGLRTLPGIGRYTAGAIASIALGERAPLVDGNVARVIARLYAMEEDPTKGAGHAKVWSIADALVPLDAPGDFNQALMELGATICTPRAPRCLLCPLARACEARARGLENELPNIASKAAPATVPLTAFVIEKDDATLLARRVHEGLFGGLWEPPTVAGHDLAAAKDGFETLFGVAPRDVEAAGTFVHVLTHRRLDVHVVRASLPPRRALRLRTNEVYDDARFFANDAHGAVGKSTLAERMLKAARDQ